MTPLGDRAVDPFGNPTWEGMQYGLLDQTPVLTRQPTNPTIADYLTEFQDRNRAWRESFKTPEYTPWSGRPQVEEEEEVVDPAADPILGQWRKPPVDFQDESQDSFNPPPIKGIDQAMAVRNALVSPLGIAGQLAVPFAGGLFGSLANMSANDEVARMLGVDQSWTDTLGGMFGYGNAVSALGSLSQPNYTGDYLDLPGGVGVPLTDEDFRQADGSTDVPAGGIQTRTHDRMGSPMGESDADVDYGWEAYETEDLL